MPCCVSRTARYISLLRLLRMVRVYRLYSWVQLMTFNTTFSLLAVTLARNFAVSAAVEHPAVHTLLLSYLLKHFMCRLFSYSAFGLCSTIINVYGVYGTHRPYCRLAA